MNETSTEPPLAQTGHRMQGVTHTSWSEQTRVTNSQAATNESWLVRCSVALWDLAKAVT